MRIGSKPSITSPGFHSRPRQWIAALAFAAIAWAALGQETAGIGVALGKDGDHVTIKAVLPDTPAGLSHAIDAGDRLIAVAEDAAPAVPVEGLKIEEVVRLLRGTKGSTVRLTISRSAEKRVQQCVVSLVRGELQALARWGDGALLKRGAKAPDIQMQLLSEPGAESLESHAGKVIVLEFWATWCGPCQEAIAKLQGYPEKYPHWSNQVVLITASADERAEQARQHLQTKGWNKTRNVHVGTDAIKACHVNALPTTYVIDQQGKVVAADHVLDLPQIVNDLLQRK